jgi:hypothetical protein
LLWGYPTPEEQLLPWISQDRAADSRPGGKVTFFLSFRVTSEAPQTCHLWFCDPKKGQEKGLWHHFRISNFIIYFKAGL